MDNDRIAGAAQKLGGGAKDAVGGALGDTKLQAEGKLDQAAGTARETFGEAKDAARDFAEDWRGEIARLRGQVEKLMRERVGPALSDATDTAEDYAQRAKEVATRQSEQVAVVVRENPLAALGVVAAVAFLLGRLTANDRAHDGRFWR